MAMKVLSIGSDRNLFVSGSESQKRIKEYGKLFDELHIVVFSTRKSEIRNPKSEKNKNLKISDGVWVYSTNSKNRWFYIWDAYKTAKSIISKPYTLNPIPWAITCQDPLESGFVGWLIKLKYKLPLQIQIHTDIFSPYFWQESLLNKIRVLLAKFLLPRADGIRVVSERIKQSLKAQSFLAGQAKLKAEPAVLPIFVDVKKIQSAKVKMDLHKKYPDHDFIILMASRLTKEKNIGLAIDAMKEIVDEKNLHPKPPILNPLLLIVGDGPELKSYKSLVKSYKLENNVIFENAVDPGTLFSYYKTADLFLLTSDYEGYGRTVIEAMAAGLPVVMTDVGLAGELLIDDLDGIVVPVGDKEALASAIKQLLVDGPGSENSVALQSSSRREDDRISTTRKEKRSSLVTESQKVINSLSDKKEYLDNYASLFIQTANQKKSKLAYLVPEYDENTPTHFAYQQRFLNKLKENFDIFLIVEKKQRKLLNFLPIRLAILIKNILIARLSGYKNFYVHYSFSGAFMSAILGGKVFYWNCGEPWKYKRSFLRDMFERLTYKSIDFLVTGADSLADKYSERYGIPRNNIKILPNWIDLKEVENVKIKNKNDNDNEKLKNKLKITNDQKVILFVHRLSKRKGAHYLPDILDRLKDENIVLIVIGDGPEREAINSQLITHNLQHLVRMLGWIPQSEILSYFAMADVFLMPSDEEGFPHVLLEAMATGTPFVASDAGAVKEITPPELRKYVISVEDIDNFADKIKALLAKSEKEIMELKSLLLDWSEKYDISKAIAKFKSLFY